MGLRPQPKDTMDPGGCRRRGRTPPPQAPWLTPVSSQWTSGPRMESFCCSKPPGFCGSDPRTPRRMVKPPSARGPLLWTHPVSKASPRLPGHLKPGRPLGAGLPSQRSSDLTPRPGARRPRGAPGRHSHSLGNSPQPGHTSSIPPEQGRRAHLPRLPPASPARAVLTRRADTLDVPP